MGMGGKRHGRSDYAEASLIAKRQIESLIQLTEAEHERVRSAVLSARPGAGEREEPSAPFDAAGRGLLPVWDLDKDAARFVNLNGVVEGR
jgi:hypothetical protein